MYELITSKSNKTTPGSTVIIRTDEDGTQWWIPIDENNSDYQAYLKSLEPEEGNK